MPKPYYTLIIMEYIIFDLEWNQCPNGKEYEVDELPFEILEIGAVKLNKDKTEIGRFHERIRPVVYLQMHFRTREILKINMESLKDARTFPAVFADFMAWCGDNPVFCTWGPSDLYELQRNLSYHGLTNPFKKPLFYYDVQKLFAVARGEYQTRRSLEHAADCLQLPREMPFHSALGDAVYTVQIFRTLEAELIRRNYSIDFYHNPKSRREEVFASYDDHTLFLSKEFSSKTQVMRDRKVCSTRCPLCRENARRRVRWFSSGNNNYYSLSWCEKHGWLLGKIHIRRTLQDKYFCIRTVWPADEETVRRILDKKENIRKRRKIK